MRSKRRKPAKTRCKHRVERDGISIRKHSDSHDEHERLDADKNQLCENREWKGDENNACEGKWENTEVDKEAIPLGNPSDSAQPIHPGSLQELRELSASLQDTDETGPEEEEPPF